MAFKKLNPIQKFLLKKSDRKKYQEYKILKLIHEAPPINFVMPEKEDVYLKHSGNSGDVIYALPSIYEIASGKKAHVRLCINVPHGLGKDVFHPLGSVMLNEKMAGMLKPLLMYQPEIASCEILTDEKIDADLDLIRAYPLLKGLGNIARWYFYIFGIQTDLSKPWLQAPKDARYKDTIVIARSHRYRNPEIDFGFLQEYGKLLFVGIKEEYEDMKKMIPHLEHKPVKDFLELATIINSCRLFIGNQSFPFSIAEGLKVKRVLEACYYCPNVNVEGPNGYDFCYQQPFEKTVALALSR